MSLRGFIKCSVVFFLMCPKRVRLEDDISDASESSPEEVKERGKVQLFNEADAASDFNHKLFDDEPGFDLGQKEMKKFKIWPEGNVPYYIDVVSFSGKVLRDKIRMFLNGVSSTTNLTFLELPVPPKEPENSRWVFFMNRRGLLGCADHSVLNFTNSGVQQVILGYDCMLTKEELAAAVLAIAGVPAQHNAPNRDKYIVVHDENIKPDKRYLFKKLNDDEWLFHDLEYDYNSAGHFHNHQHSINGEATILEIGASQGNLSPGGLSGTDIKKINMLYNYIGNKKGIKLPDCKKLFRKGNNFNTQTKSLAKIKPRKLPAKYLGTASDSQKTDAYVSSELGEVVPEYESIQSNIDEKDSEETSDKGEFLKGVSDTGHEFLKGPGHQKQKRKKKNPSFDLLSRLSDYDSDSRKLRAKPKNNTNVQMMTK